MLEQAYHILMWVSFYSFAVAFMLGIIAGSALALSATISAILAPRKGRK